MAIPAEHIELEHKDGTHNDNFTEMALTQTFENAPTVMMFKKDAQKSWYFKSNVSWGAGLTPKNDFDDSTFTYGKITPPDPWESPKEEDEPALWDQI